jgi:cell division protein ZipA
LGELRWILLGLGTLAIGAIWWWSARRSTQAPGNAELRESTVVPAHSLAPAAVESLPPEKRPLPSEVRERAASPLDPLSIRTADFERVPALDQPMLTHADPLDLTVELGQMPEEEPPATAARPPPPQAPPPTVKFRPSTENSDRLGAAAPQSPAQSPNASEKQKIVTIRVCAVGDARWSGSDLMSTLEGQGLAYGRYQVYHRNHNDGRSIFCVASLVEPGTFDMARMAEDEFRGVSLFAVLPGPLEPVQTIDALLTTARELARELSGTVQDAKGMPFSPQRAAALREDAARFQALLP